MGGRFVAARRRTSFVLAVTAALCAVTPPALAQAPGSAEPRVALAVSAPSRVAPGEPVPLALTVTNRGDAACEVVAASAGTVRVTDVTLDGAPVAPVFGSVRYVMSLPAALATKLTTLQPGAGVDVPFGAETAGLDLEDVELTTVDALPHGDGLTSSWSLRRPGRYAVSLVYSTPASVGATPCPGVSAVATATFVVGSAQAGPLRSLARSRWVAAGAGAALLLLVALVVLVRRSRRRVPATLLLLLLSGAALTAPPPPAAHAQLVFDEHAPLGLVMAANACLHIFRGPGGDPAMIMSAVDNASAKIPIRARRSIDETDAFVVSSDGRQTVYWKHSPDGHLLEPGVPRDPCSELYHELAHAKEYVTTGKLDKRKCGSLSTETTEARATLAENKYRASRKLPVRKTYSGFPLPDKASDCDKRKAAANERKPGTCAAAAAGAAPCDPDLPPDPPPTPPPAMSNGDPHLATLDGLYYDFQAVGEFVAVRSATGDLEIQTRQSPFEASRTVSVNTAVALRIGPDRLSLTSAGGEIAVVLNGQPERWERGTRSLPGGGKVARRESPVTFGQDGYTVRWADGSRAWVDVLGPYALRLFVSLAPQRAGTVTGLFGDFDGEPEGDLVRRDGQPIGAPTFENLYPAFADDWRVDAAGSLFAYPPGKDTAAFTDKAFPERAVTVADLPAADRDRARAVCAAAGVTDPAQLDACVLDVAVTGDVAFAVNSGDVHRATVPPPPPVVEPRAGDRTLAVDRPQGTAELTFPGKAGQRVFVDIVTSTLPDACGVLGLLGPAGEGLGSGCVIKGAGMIDAVTLPVTGTYTLRLDPEGDATGRAVLRISHPVDERGTVTLDGPAVPLNVPEPGAVSRLAFTVPSPTKVFVDVTSSTLPDQCGHVSVVHPDGSTIARGCVIAPNGFVDAVALKDPGTYTLVVDPVERGTGQASIRVTSARDHVVDVAVGGAAVVAEIRQYGAEAILRFVGRAGQQVTVEASGSTLPEECGLLWLHGPDGTRFAHGCVIGGAGGIDAATLPADGAYTLVVNPSARGTGQVTLRLR